LWQLSPQALQQQCFCAEGFEKGEDKKIAESKFVKANEK